MARLRPRRGNGKAHSSIRGLVRPLHRILSRVVILFMIPALLYVCLLPVLPLMEPDETRYSDIPSLMNRTGDGVTPRLNHVLYFEKPPLAYWATALLFKGFGENEFAARLFTGLCTWGLILLAYAAGRHQRDEKAGLYCAAVMSTFFFVFALGRINLLDMPLALFTGLAIWSGWRYLSDSAPRRQWLYLLYGSSALAFLTKGLIGIVFPFAILVLWLVADRRWREIPRLLSPVGMLLSCAVALPWLVLVQKANPDFFWFFFFQEHFLRYATTMHGRDQSLFMYIPVLLAGTLPWSAFLWQIWKERDREAGPLFGRSEKRFLWTWVIFIFLFFTFSSSKLIPYLSPLFVPAAVFFGQLFRRHDEQAPPADAAPREKRLYRVPVYLLAVLVVGALSAPLFLNGMQLRSGALFPVPDSWPLLAAAPMAAILLLAFLPEWLRSKLRRGWFASAYLLSVVFLASLVFPASCLLTNDHTSGPLAKAVRLHVPAGEALYQFRVSLYGFDFYNHLRAPVVEDFGELSFGIRHLQPDERARYFLSAEEFYRLCQEKHDIYAVTQYKEWHEEIRGRVSEMTILWDNGVYYLIRIRC